MWNADVRTEEYIEEVWEKEKTIETIQHHLFRCDVPNKGVVQANILVMHRSTGIVFNQLLFVWFCEKFAPCCCQTTLLDWRGSYDNSFHLK